MKLLGEHSLFWKSSQLPFSYIFPGKGYRSEAGLPGCGQPNQAVRDHCESALSSQQTLRTFRKR